ncbi:MAG: extracellular solute-binding protein [Termitinemataceae bacterium]|nr:MAG: extracellular solute-binding protein [Termitinemataceae bacterium]
MLWTDRPEFAFYAQAFNLSQNDFKIELKQFDDLSSRLITSKERPDIVVGSWLKSSKTISRFRPLDKIMRKNSGLKDNLYLPLLNLGKNGRKQYLLPVSFDLPLIIFSETNSSLINDQFVIDIEDVKTLGASYNKIENGVAQRIGFSPLWNPDFLFETARIFGASFKESDTVQWDQDALNKSIVFLKDWVTNVNGGVQVEDDFFYKYFFNPSEELITQGRILFAYMRSSDFFTKTKSNLNIDFRLLASGMSNTKIIPIYEGAVYYGIDKKSRADNACEAFTLWFFKDDTQEALLKQSQALHIHDTSFGIANGYSAMRSVTENIFPRFYPELLGHMKEQEYLMPAQIKPLHWVEMKERVIIPYLKNICKTNNADMQTLESEIEDWARHRLFSVEY